MDKEKIKNLMFDSSTSYTGWGHIPHQSDNLVAALHLIANDENQDAVEIAANALMQYRGYV